VTRAGSRFAAILFDLDGVLVDAEIWWDEVRADFARMHGRPWMEDDRRAVMGANSRQWARTMRVRLDLAIEEVAIERAIVDAVVARYRAEGAPEIERGADVVRGLVGRWPLGLASSAHREVIDAALAGLGLADSFDVVVSSDEVAHGKPSPDVYRLAADRIGVPPEACLVIEDSLPGVRAAKAAGMTVVLIPNHAVPPADGATEAADVVLARLADLEVRVLDGAGEPAIARPRPG
jgi:beta-phosphoglucomutase-like phosphatase (HAD superfamily)